MYAAVNGLMDDVPVERVREFEERFLGYMETSKPELLAAILEKKDLDEAIEDGLKEAITAFKASF